MGIKVSQFIKDQWLNVERAVEADILGTPLTVERIYTRKIGGENKLVVGFKETERHLPLNQTNLRVMHEGSGGCDDAMDWRGMVVELYVDEGVMVRGEEQRGLRVEVKSFTPVAKAGK